MSLLLDALRRGKAAPDEQHSPARRANVDAVLATLGYRQEPWHQKIIRSEPGTMVLYGLCALIVGLATWRAVVWYTEAPVGVGVKRPVLATASGGHATPPLTRGVTRAAAPALPPLPLRSIMRPGGAGLLPAVESLPIAALWRHEDAAYEGTKNADDRVAKNTKTLPEDTKAANSAPTDVKKIQPGLRTFGDGVAIAANKFQESPAASIKTTENRPPRPLNSVSMSFDPPQKLEAKHSIPSLPAPVLPEPQPLVKPAATTPTAVQPAQTALSRAVSIAPAPSGPALSTVRSESDHFKLAVYYQRAGDFENALIHYRAILERNELNAEVHNNLGLLYENKGLTEEAVKEFQRAIFIDQKYVKAHNNLGVALLNRGKIDAAAAEFRAALAADPRSVDAHVNLALALKAGGRREEAQEVLITALSIDSHHPASHYNLALLYEEGGEIAKAIDHYQQFLKYGGVEHADLGPDVRSRIDALTTRLIP